MGYCKWTKGCTSPGPWAAWIDGKFYECLDPERASREYDEYAEYVDQINQLAEAPRGDQAAQDLLRNVLRELDKVEVPRPIYCRLHAREFVRLNIVNTITEDGESVRNPKASPLLLFCRRQIDQAIDGGKETDPATGEPTDEAFCDRLWLEYKPDQKDREDYVGSFDWCCHWLSLDADATRRDALEEIEFSLARRLLEVKRAEFDRRKYQVLAAVLSQEEQTILRVQMVAKAQRDQLVLF